MSAQVRQTFAFSGFVMLVLREHQSKHILHLNNVSNLIFEHFLCEKTKCSILICACAFYPQKERAAETAFGQWWQVDMSCVYS